MHKSSERGFTLIELVVVIVILGILAAFAVPRFAKLDQQARISSVRSLEGTLRSAATMAHAQWIAQGRTGTVNMDGGGNLTFVQDYPNAATIQRTLAQGTVQTNVPGRFNVQVAGTTTTFQLFGATNVANCQVTYTEAAAGGAPSIATTAAGTMSGTNGC
jgi:MSHA pilin protein MshA